MEGAKSTNVSANTDEHIVKYEVFDADVMDELLKQTSGFSKKDLANLSRYKKGRLQGNTVEVVYHYGKGCEESRLGRLYAKNNQGLQAFPFDMRNPLLEKYYWDVDMENAHYNILAKLADSWGLKTNAIRQYIANRDVELMKVSSSRMIAKTAFLKVAYGGNIKMYNEHYNDDGISADGDLTLLREIESEMKNIVDTCWYRHESFHKIVRKKTNTHFSLFALILQTEERKCLLAMDNYMKSQGRQIDIFIHDGGEVRKLDNEIQFPDYLLRGAETYIKENVGYDLKLVVKPFKHSFKMPETSHQNVDDQYVATYFIKLLGDKIARDGETVYYFDDETGLWASGDSIFRKIVAQHKSELIFQTAEGVLNYGGKEKNVSTMSKWILSSLEDTKFLTKNADTSIGKFLFIDGIFDFNTGFTKGFNPAIVFNNRINRMFPTERDEELIAEIERVLFVNAFDEGDGKLAGQYLKQALAIGLYGDYQRKKFYLGLGEANCGKGVLVNALQCAFEGYITSFDGNNLKYNARSGQDEAKRLGWVKDLYGSRLAFSSELRMDGVPMDGNLVKSLASGGDEMFVRKNFQDGSPLVNRTTMFCLANDFTSITPVDSGVQERLRFIRYRLQFVDEPRHSYQKKKNPSIKNDFKTDEYKNALFWCMVDAYRNLPRNQQIIGGSLKEPECVIEETKEWIHVDVGISDHIEQNFTITNNPEDMIPTSAVIDYLLSHCKVGMSKTKISREIAKLIQLPGDIDCIKVVKVSGKSVKHYVGMK